MNVYYDLHIHSCLSPCADDDMTPANIAAMARIKGLSLIALTDHNSGRNLPAMAAAAHDMIFVPGIEVTSSEEVHILTYFNNVETAVAFGDAMHASLPDIPHRPDIFGRQIVMNTRDEQDGTQNKLLLSATAYTLEQITAMARRQGGCAVPAHINRDSFSVFSNLGFLPPGLFGCVEVAPTLPCPPLENHIHILQSSDAHTLGDIAEPCHTLQSTIKSAEDFVIFVNEAVSTH